MLQNNLTNVQLVNLNLSKGILSLKENNERLEGRVRSIVSETVRTFKRLKGRKKYEYLAEKVFFIVFKHEVCMLKEIIESEREKYKKQSELRILSLYKEIQSLETQVNSSSKKMCEQESLLIEFEQKMTFLINT